MSPIRVYIFRLVGTPQKSARKYDGDGLLGVPTKVNMKSENRDKEKRRYEKNVRFGEENCLHA